MKITFPHLGNTYLASKALFDGLGIDSVIPPPSNKKALEIGSLYSPEEICLPFKIMIGNYIQSIEKGADTVIITGSCGPCRFGEYCELQINILKKLGYDLDFIVIDAPTKNGIGKKEFLNRINKISSASTKKNSEKIKALKYSYNVITLIDKIEAKAHYLAGYELNKGECKILLNKCKLDSAKSTSPQEMINILKYYKNKLDKVPINKDKNPLKIAIIGEIYTILEPFSNLYIEDKLMDYGVSSSRHLTPSWWVKDAALKPLKLNSLDLRIASKKYLPFYIGGHGRECIGEVMLAKKYGFDGAIQIFPMGCMPEIVTKSILPSISKNEDFPVMSLIVDEMTGEAGYITRIEAFLDMLERRKNKNVLYGCRRRFS
ncbi:2-hydroxyglutaryl-CoA dehydratase, D-component [Clostridium tepidiprofundi DSM 19306]|uniref:2-hydroxyglutaryl-CoA dehydratase, D-component n=1 Tax=Clostridium tepidiprofundi DSM 19306 TaxID=1121338 RepID=A0A151B630_9CLOT|nr:2-hydroxyglutaryl-CoA dehydratase [Clostridium tepidiprofundi]KYH35356.1 2-hydroxyglutaryl-CoA dehydratase, D-component [Clostridium tepidiprofundi DSM 19306]